jgi:hypothetical protein
MSKIAQTVGDAVRNVQFDQSMHSDNARTYNPAGNQGNPSNNPQPTHHTPQENPFGPDNPFGFVGIDFSTIDPSTYFTSPDGKVYQWYEGFLISHVANHRGASNPATGNGTTNSFPLFGSAGAPTSIKHIQTWRAEF